jgi:tryptophan synthase alpha chain
MESVSATILSDRIARRFDSLRSEKRRALVCYITAGHPDPAASLELLQGLEEAGADIIEVGVPFSDPLADGPVIQESSQVAVANGFNFDSTLELIARARVGIPVVLFSYLNPVLSAGKDALQRAGEAGADGILITDLPLGADPELESWLAEGPLDYIRLVAPTTPPARMAAIARTGSGFVYLISRLGVTGESSQLAPALGGTVTALRSATDLPICVGFGISTADQAREVGRLADGVVVGSALVRAAGRSVGEALALVAALRHGIDQG